MIDARTWAIVAVAGVGTFLLRYSFLALFHRIDEVPPRVRTALRYVPAAVLAALVVPNVVLAGETATAAVAPARLLAGALAALVAWRTESVLWTILSGLLALGLLRLLPV